MKGIFPVLLTFFLMLGVVLTQPSFAQSPISTSSSSSSSSSSSVDSIFQIGEELTYNVSYASIDIGQVRIKLLERYKKDDRTYYKATAYIDSYKGLPFVNLHAIYENIIDQSVYSTWFHSRTKKEDHWFEFIYNFDYPRHALCIDQGTWKSGTIDRRDTLRLDTLYQDGLSLFYFARKEVMTNQRIDIPTVVSEKKGKTFINFTTEHMKEEIEALKYPVDVVHFEGEAGFVGIFGLTGGFEGWFSNDAARVPVLAKMKVLIGNIRIELMQWKRQGWDPPKYVSDRSK